VTDGLTAPADIPVQPVRASLAGRRAMFATLVLVTMAALLTLALVAVPPFSAGAVAFLFLFAVTLPWSVVGFWNATIGFLIMRLSRDPVKAVNPLVSRVRGDEPIIASTAILMCIRNEQPHSVVRNLDPLLEGLVNAGVARLFHVYVLSDTNIPEIAAIEEASVDVLAAKWRAAIPVTYRRRPLNLGFKAGNIRDFCDRWGERHEFAVVMDADSYMPADAVLRLVRLMQANATLGILQTLVVGLPSISPFARVFQFGMRLGMRSYTLGSAWWQGDCGPYWGHNAILRLKPFIAHCHLPKFAGSGPLSGHVLSHDQVEAALMRRAGYEVRVLPEDGKSFEENPPTLLEFIRRDLRWCHGNMQYWQLLSLPGLRPVSRFQLLFAILMYLGSPAWMALVAMGTIAIAMAGTPTAPSAPVKLGPGTALFIIMMSMIFAPKIASIIDIMLRRSARRAFGGGLTFIGNVLNETLFTFLLTPITSLMHSVFLFRLFVLRQGGAWEAQIRDSHAVSWMRALSKLWPPMLAGCGAMGLIALTAPRSLGYEFIAVAGLVLAVPFAVFTASSALGSVLARTGLGRIPEETEPPAALQPLRLPAVEASRAGAPKLG
jgi:membrane glycosyltransferase